MLVEAKRCITAKGSTQSYLRNSLIIEINQPLLVTFKQGLCFVHADWFRRTALFLHPKTTNQNKTEYEEHQIRICPHECNQHHRYDHRTPVSWLGGGHLDEVGHIRHHYASRLEHLCHTWLETEA